MPAPIVVTVRADTRPLERALRKIGRRLWLLRVCLWANALPGRLCRWLARHTPIVRGEVRRLARERDEAREVAGVLHLHYWSLLGRRNRQDPSGKN